MGKRLEQVKSPMGISDAAVQAKTGKTWDEWFAVLDGAQAARMNHREIVAYLHQHHDVGAWWQQMLTVGYERQRGLREPHEKPDGYSVSRTKTVDVPAEQAYEVWEDAKLRRRWLPEGRFTVRKGTPGKSLRLTWSADETSVEVNFYPRGEDRCQVSVQHNKLPDALAGERMKSYWADALERLKTILED